MRSLALLIKSFNALVPCTSSNIHGVILSLLSRGSLATRAIMQVFVDICITFKAKEVAARRATQNNPCLCCPSSLRSHICEAAVAVCRAGHLPAAAAAHCPVILSAAALWAKIQA